MQAIELETDIDENREIHLSLPSDVQARKTRVVVLYEQPTAEASAEHQQVPKPVKLGLFRGQIQMTDDFDDPLPDAVWLGNDR